MVALNTVLDTSLLAEMVTGGYVRVQTHPTLPLAIYNYTEKAQYEHVWNDVTRTCRGLIVDQRTNEVIARPFPKFFNHGETEAGILDLDARTIVTDKADGSLGILFASDGQWHVATRGSFASDQAIHATKLYRERYADRFTPSMQWTHLFEIVYPANRIVLDYDGLDDLIHLGTVNVATGETTSPNPTWHGKSVQEFPYATLADALAAEPRPNAEGLVVHFTETDTRVKVKQADYVALHRIVTGLNARTVWQHLVDGKPLAALIEPLPDEFHDWVRAVASDLEDQIDKLTDEVEAAWGRVQAQLPDGASRKDFALLAKTEPHSWALFSKVDNRDYRVKLWKQVDPGVEWRPTNAPSEEAA